MFLWQLKWIKCSIDPSCHVLDLYICLSSQTPSWQSNRPHIMLTPTELCAGLPRLASTRESC